MCTTSASTRVFDDQGRAGPLDPLPPSARLQVSQRLRQVDLRVPDARTHRNVILALHLDEERGEGWSEPGCLSILPPARQSLIMLLL